MYAINKQNSSKGSRSSASKATRMPNYSVRRTCACCRMDLLNLFNYLLSNLNITTDFIEF